jgi:hypothetical protein
MVRGEMKETTVTASGVVEVIDNCGETNGYFFDVGGDKVIYLREGTLRDAAEYARHKNPDDDTFLPSAFRVEQYPDGRRNC